MKETIGNFLFRRLLEVGIGEVFGVPGDFNLNLMQQLEDRGEPRWFGNCNELNASYAADGYARIKGLSALVVTNGVGALSAINGVAGAFAEHVPVICICGSLPTSSIARARLMHHTFADGTHDEFYRAFAEVTAAQARITQANAATEIDRMITTAWQMKRPVYLEIPSDLSYLEIDTPEQALQLTEPSGDRERIQSCSEAILQRLSSAKVPVLLLDMDVDRFRVDELVTQLAEKGRIPVATMSGAKGVFSERNDLFVGQYSGAGSAVPTKEAVEGSDCLIMIGYRRVDSTSGFFSDRLPTGAICLNAFHAEVNDEHFAGVTLVEVLRSVLTRLPAHPTRPVPPSSSPLPPTGPSVSNGELKQQQYWAALQSHLRPGDILIAEDGTSSSGAGSFHLPEGCTFITQAIWGSIGYTLGCLLGTLVAAPERRSLLFIGDGSFQLTAQELSTILRHELKPHIFLINNAGYTIERTILGMTARYNDVANWSYVDLPKVFSRRVVQSVVVETEEDLRKVLEGNTSEFLLVESRMAPDDSPVGLIKGGHASADTDYGPRGPQKARGAQIPLPGGANR